MVFHYTSTRVNILLQIGQDRQIGVKRASRVSGEGKHEGTFGTIVPLVSHVDMPGLLVQEAVQGLLDARLGVVRLLLALQLVADPRHGGCCCSGSFILRSPPSKSTSTSVSVPLLNKNESPLSTRARPSVPAAQRTTAVRFSTAISMAVENGKPQ